ncbi:hypothetical protein SAMN05444156_3263 [Verrucomicrobium sp. GAS474]|uniref:hypothetical protein n=1 Tax=Verrucomicrobium sp. GAS474 TaxID=1882831 RepID=UPI00087DC012|nr:hypothetical protein [Verrucomicrobium sp. GAS474]SDU31780.1 hypothetical protein SAMN05444156_3263 [Verrucomicrobium sp. GAS474]
MWTEPHAPVFDAQGKCAGYRVSAYYVTHFTDLAATYGTRFHPALKGGEGMTATDTAGFVTVDRDLQNMSLARWAREAAKP